MDENMVYFLVKKRSDGRLQSVLDNERHEPYAFSGRMLPDRLGRAFRADGKHYFVVSVDLSVETPNIMPRGY